MGNSPGERAGFDAALLRQVGSGSRLWPDYFDRRPRPAPRDFLDKLSGESGP